MFFDLGRGQVILVDSQHFAMTTRVIASSICISAFLSSSLAELQTQYAWSPYHTLLQQPHCPLPVDDATELGTQIWTHRPLCSGSLQASKPTSKINLCVYTSSNYYQGFGISLISTPEIAASVACVISRNVVSGRHDNYEQVNLKTDHRAPYDDRDIPGKGTGDVATRK